MTTCAACGQENPSGFRFCGACGASLAACARARRAKDGLVLFAHLVGDETRSRWHRALHLHAAGDLVAACDELAAIGSRTDEARLRLRAAEVLADERQGREQLERALAFYRSVGATLYLRRGERLLQASA